LHEHASLVTNQIKNFNYIVKTYKSRSADFINIGTTPSLAITIVPKLIKHYKESHPETKFNLINLNSIDLIEDRYKPDIDITICFNAKEQNSIDVVVLNKGKHYLVSAKNYIEITNLLSIYAKSSIMNFLVENEINMNFYLKTDSYTSALALINQGIGIAIIDENTIQNVNLELVNVSKIIDNSFEYCINAIMKKNIPKNESREFFNFLSLQGQ
jgi:DNA-binding transcriptional LysR family regulator